MKKHAWMIFCLLALLSTGAAAEVYKWKDKSGRTQYSDWPPPSNVPYTTLTGKKSAGESAAGVSVVHDAKPGDPGTPSGQAADNKQAGDKTLDEAAQKKAAEEKLAKEAEAKKLQEERLALEKKAREMQCKNAKSRVAQFEQGGRIYRVDEQGERQYYGDQDIADELAKARADVDELCSE